MATIYIHHTTGANLYYKPSPLATSTWSTGVVVGTENGTTGEYAFTVGDTEKGVIFLRAGAEPAASDIRLAQTDTTTPPTAVTNAEAVWDRVLSGATHNIATSAGRRLRALQDFGVYSGGAVWIDTIQGTAGVVEFENGTVTNPSDDLTDATTIAESLNLRHFHVANGSNITMAQAYDFYEFSGDEYTIALGGQSINNTSIRDALLITGTYTGYPHVLRSIVGDITGPGAKLGMCAIRGAVVLNANTNIMVMHDCWTTNASLAAMDFGSGVGTNVVYLQNFNGAIEIRNMEAGDVLWHSGKGKVTLASSCTGGTVNIAGTIELVDNSTGVTINEVARVDSESGGGGDGNLGSGSQEKELTIQVSGNPVDGAAVWVTTDLGGTNVIAGTLHTNGLGKVKFMLDPTGEGEHYYAWCQKNGINFSNPTQFHVVAT